MKKILYSVLALGAIATLASCSSEEPLGPNDRPNDGKVTFNVALPDMGTRAFGDRPTINCDELKYTVYDAAGANVILPTATVDAFGEGVLNDDVTLQLVANESYKIVFYAHNKASKFSTYANGHLSVNYVTNNINSELDDAFYAAYDFIADGNAKNVTLKRPFAQINIGTDDLDNAAVKKVLANVTSTLTVSNGLCNSMNLLTGKAELLGNGLGNVTFSPKVAPAVNEDFPYQPAKYSNLLSAYLLVPAEQDIIEATYVIMNGTKEMRTLNLSGTPVQMNYRTNIYGSLLTTQNQFNVTIEPAFDGTNNIVDGAVVKMVNGKVVCTTPALPAGVAAADLEGKGGVALDAQGNPVYFEADGHSINTAMQNCSEIYFAPNVTINTGSHWMNVPQSGITVHGNGATLTGGEQDFAIQYTTYADGSTVNININNLNGVKVWGGPTANATFNINLTNCTQANGNMIMVRGGDTAPATVNMNLENCYAEGMVDAIHTTYAGTQTISNCTFKNVGIPLNIAKKLAGRTSDIKVTNCTFNTCGILPTDTQNIAYNYAAPIRVVDNGGPANAITLLVDNCKFINTQSEWDILLMDYRDGKTWFPVKYTIQNCTPANPTVKATAN